MLTNLKNNRNFKRISSVILTLAIVLTINGAISFAAGDTNKATSLYSIPRDTPQPKATALYSIPKNTPRPKAIALYSIPKDTPQP
ncbi:MAG: hypothetical protein Q8K98_07745 [Bacteroidota bacterium]|nr:hypothetical protein [Bacteroidota bacterium]